MVCSAHHPFYFVPTQKVRWDRMVAVASSVCANAWPSCAIHHKQACRQAPLLWSVVVAGAWTGNETVADPLTCEDPAFHAGRHCTSDCALGVLFDHNQRDCVYAAPLADPHKIARNVSCVHVGGTGPTVHLPRMIRQTSKVFWLGTNDVNVDARASIQGVAYSRLQWVS